MEDKDPREFYDESSRLWYTVKWDEEIQRFVWHIAPYQRLIAESESQPQEK